MAKVLAIIFLVVFAFWAYPHIANAEWFAPAPTPNYWWGNSYGTTYNNRQNAGWVQFDFWNRRGQVSAGYGNGYNYPYQQPSYIYNTPVYGGQTTYYGNTGINQPFTYQTYGYQNGTYYQNGSNTPFTYCNCYSYPTTSIYTSPWQGSYGYYGTNTYGSWY